jgi:tetratricopeptide (TPR) repeat protein
LSSTSTEQRLPVLEEVVATLTSAAGSGYGGAAALRAGMRRATDQFDEHAAAALARSLVDCLCKSPDDVRVLETLVILGLAHPGALAQHRISLVTEGRRLAFLLEKAGQFERAYCLGELIAERAPAAVVGVSAEDTAAVEQLVRDAELAAVRGRTEAAIRCLEEAQRLDPARPDLSRAIRDLRRKQELKSKGAKHSLKLAIALVLFSGILTTVAVREIRIWGRWKAIPEANSDDVAAMRARLAGIESLLDSEVAWCTMPFALLDRDLLKHDIELRSRPIVPASTDVPSAAEEIQNGKAYADAETERTTGLKLAQEGHIDEAIQHLRRALKIAPPDWYPRERIEADVAALDAWKKKNP